MPVRNAPVVAAGRRVANGRESRGAAVGAESGGGDELGSPLTVVGFGISILEQS